MVNKLSNYVFMSYDPFVCDNPTRKLIIRRNNKYAPLKCTKNRSKNFYQIEAEDASDLNNFLAKTMNLGSYVPFDVTDDKESFFALNLPYPVNCYNFGLKYQTCAEIIPHRALNFIEIQFECCRISSGTI